MEKTENYKLTEIRQQILLGNMSPYKFMYESLEELQQAALQGNMYAQYYLGLEYEIGKELPRDDVKAGEWYKKAAASGWAKDKLAEWYQKAAERGQVDAQYNLGLMYDKGDGIKVDVNKALNWYQMAAAQGHVEAQFRLGEMYENGTSMYEVIISFPKDASKSLDWYQKAAAQGHTEAHRRLKIYDSAAQRRKELFKGESDRGKTTDIQIKKSLSGIKGALEKTQQKKFFDNIFGYLGVFLLLGIAVLHFIEFMNAWLNNGYKQAERTAPVGSLIFYIVAVIAYIMSIPFLRRRGYDRIASAMAIVGTLVAIVFLASIFGLSPTPQDCELTRSGYICR